MKWKRDASKLDIFHTLILASAVEITLEGASNGSELYVQRKVGKQVMETTLQFPISGNCLVSMLI
jgi:hypothetical protein